MYTFMYIDGWKLGKTRKGSKREKQVLRRERA